MPVWPLQTHHDIDEHEYLTELTPADVRKIRIQEDMEEIAALRAQEHGEFKFEIETEVPSMETYVPSAEPVEPMLPVEPLPKKKKKYTGRGDLRREFRGEEEEPAYRHWERAKKRHKAEVEAE